MARAAPKPCAHAGCAALVFDGSGWCDKHRKQGSGKFADRLRGSRHERGYGTAWEKLRKQILSRDKGLCQVCLEVGRYSPARTVDHIKPKALGGTDDPINLRAICDACHKRKTASEGAAGGGRKLHDHSA